MIEREMTNFNDTAKLIYEDNAKKGFWDKERNVGEMLMLVTSELGEAMEAHRKGKFTKDLAKDILNEGDDPMSHEGDILFKNQVKDTFEDEIADSIIRLFDMAGGLKIDLDFHIKTKLAYNKTREKLHGKKY